jgi:hypothetical protein
MTNHKEKFEEWRNTKTGQEFDLALLAAKLMPDCIRHSVEKLVIERMLSAFAASDLNK